HQAGLASNPPAVQIRDGSGVWRTVVPEMGLPVGRPQTIVVDLTEALGTSLSRTGFETCSAGLSGPRRAALKGPPYSLETGCSDSRARPGPLEVRIVTTLRVYWDQILVDTSEPAPFTIGRIDARAAALRWRGFSAEATPDGAEPFRYDYERVSPAAPWKTMPGRYTRFGDVAPLLST